MVVVVVDWGFMSDLVQQVGVVGPTDQQVPRFHEEFSPASSSSVGQSLSPAMS